MNKPILQIEALSHRFDTPGGHLTALRDINLEIREHDVVTLIGQPGTGKSTLLKLIAGLLMPSAGGLICAGREIAGPGPERAVVFQNHSLLPWLDCYENIYLAVERVFGAKDSKAKLRGRTLEALKMVEMNHARDKYPHELNEGMKQRVGIARALAMEPKILLMDEPFAALDAVTRANLQDELMNVILETGATTIIATHDADEAVLLSDRIVLMTNGPTATLGEILEIQLAWPRDRVQLANSEAFSGYRAAVLDFLYRKQLRPAA